MNWHSLVRRTLAEENPDLDSQLSRSKEEHEDYVKDVARRTQESYKTVTANMTDPARQAAAREIAQAQAQEEIAPPELMIERIPEELRELYGED